MKYCLLIVLLCSSLVAFSQQLQLHYDLRHTIDPAHSRKNFPALYFEYFKSPDSAGASIVKPGSFLIKMQAEFNGERNNTGQFYMQVSQAIRFWKPKVFLQLQYNGGLGIAEPGANGYYLTNAFSLGCAYPFQSGGKAFFNVYASYKYTSFRKASHDIISAFFWLRFFSNYKNNFTGNLVFWTENRNHGDAFTATNRGKESFVFSDPQCWFTLYRGFSAGSKINFYWHVLTADNRVQVFPTLALKYQF